ncbi:hypothetical protein, partial [Corynebacterium aurimucosum]|uniref:hypothetical protein n=1 Tax=Corynebacterium aurimucosum TaxID=169292 RepID=UPI0031E1D430
PAKAKQYQNSHQTHHPTAANPSHTQQQLKGKGSPPATTPLPANRGKVSGHTGDPSDTTTHKPQQGTQENLRALCQRYPSSKARLTGDPATPSPASRAAGSSKSYEILKPLKANPPTKPVLTG